MKEDSERNGLLDKSAFTAGFFFGLGFLLATAGVGWVSFCIWYALTRY